MFAGNPDILVYEIPVLAKVLQKIECLHAPKNGETETSLNENANKYIYMDKPPIE